MKIKQYANAWYYSGGIFTERTHAIYRPSTQCLTIIDVKKLPQIINHLKQDLNISRVSIIW